MFSILSLTTPLPPRCDPADVKEHDVLEPIREEPHHQEGPPAEELPLDQEVGGEMLPSSTNAGSAEEPGVGGVSGFLSGFAAAVQSTVSPLLP